MIQHIQKRVSDEVGLFDPPFQHTSFKPTSFYTTSCKNTLVNPIKEIQQSPTYYSDLPLNDIAESTYLFKSYITLTLSFRKSDKRYYVN